MSGILTHAWVIVPAFREAAVIRHVIEELKAVCTSIVVVDDGSGDETGSEALAGGAIVLTHVVNLGQGAALQTGIDFALQQGAEYVFTFDADGQHLPESLAVLADTMQRTGAEVVLGSRWLGRVEAMPWLRGVILRLAVLFTRLHSGLPLTDTHNGLRLLTRRAAELLRLSQPRMAHASELLAGIGAHQLRFAEAPVAVRYTEYSLRKGQKLSGVFRVLADMLFASWMR